MKLFGNWPHVRLGDVCKKIGSGSTPRGGDSVYQSEGPAIIRSQNVYNGLFNFEGLAHLSNEHAEQLNGVAVEAGDVLLNITGDSVARCCQAPVSVIPARVNQHVAIIRPDHGRLTPRFLCYYVTSPLMQSYLLSIAGSGGTRKALTKGMIEEFEVPCPSIAIQDCIADILSAYDDLIENNRRRMTLLEESARLLYQEWFVRLRFPGHEHVRVVDRVPQGWTNGTVADFYKTASGATPSRKVPDHFIGDIPWVKTQELPNGFIIDTTERITDGALKGSSAKLFPERTVLVALYGATVGQVGILSMQGATNQACCAVMPLNDCANYIHAFLFFRENKSNLMALSAGAAQNNISQQIIREFKMVLPSRQLMDTFVEVLTPVFNQWLNLEHQNHKLRAARDLLLPRLMSGEVEV